MQDRSAVNLCTVPQQANWQQTFYSWLIFCGFSDLTSCSPDLEKMLQAQTLTAHKQSQSLTHCSTNMLLIVLSLKRRIYCFNLKAYLIIRNSHSIFITFSSLGKTCCAFLSDSLTPDLFENSHVSCSFAKILRNSGALLSPLPVMVEINRCPWSSIVGKDATDTGVTVENEGSLTRPGYAFTCCCCSVLVWELFLQHESVRLKIRVFRTPWVWKLAILN